MDDDKAARRAKSERKLEKSQTLSGMAKLRLLAVFGSISFALVSSLLPGAVQVAGVTSMVMAHVMVLVACLATVFQLLDMEPLKEKTKVRFALVVVAIGFFYWFDSWLVKQRAETDMANAGPFLSVESAGPFYTISQDNQPFPPKVSRYAKIKVTNIGKRRISNVSVVVIRVNNQDELLHPPVQLPLSSIDNQLNLPNPPSMVTSTGMNPGDEKYFDVLVECNGHAGCPKGELVFLNIENGRRIFFTPSGKGYSRLEEFTVRASGDVGAPVTKTFVLLLEPSGKLQLKSQVGEGVR